MHGVLLFLHSWMRWIVVVVGIIVVVRAWWGWLGKHPWSAADERWVRLFPILVDIQVVLGILLLMTGRVISPLFNQGMKALAESQTRFWVSEHVIPMLGALVLTHVGYVFARRSESEEAKYRWVAVVFGLAMLIVLFSIPWPFSRVARPFFRFF